MNNNKIDFHKLSHSEVEYNLFVAQYIIQLITGELRPDGFSESFLPDSEELRIISCETLTASRNDIALLPLTSPR